MMALITSDCGQVKMKLGRGAKLKLDGGECITAAHAENMDCRPTPWH